MKVKTVVLLSSTILLFMMLFHLFSENRREELVKLDFIEEDLFEIQLMDSTSAKNKEILFENSIDEITQVFYTVDSDGHSEVYSYIVIDGKYYDLGRVSYDAAYLEDHLITPTHITSENPIYKWTEFHGANYSRSNYILIQKGIPYLLISIDGNTFEKDIDHDGNIETIASHGTAVEAFLYRWDVANGKIYFTNLNNNLGSPSVIFLKDKNRFEAAIPNACGGYSNVLYRYEKGILYPIR